jgi:NADH pyrophosphatase NudC (nudix superfamily)
LIKHCCEKLKNDLDDKVIEYDDGRYSVNGCCGGGCYVMSNIKFCPHCGTKLTLTEGN